jgi:3-deoxy-D-arabino-heptulosonate 7-phosphate (DAHP) synthase
MKNQELLACAAGASGLATSCWPQPGHAGSKARAAALTPAQRKEIARKAAAKRWAKTDKNQ